MVRPEPAIDPRVRDRRRQVNRETRRRRRRVVARVLALATAVIGAGAAVQSPLLDVDRLTVRGTRNTADATVAAAAGIGTRRVPMLTLDRERIASTVEALPWVAQAKVARRWPSTLEITIIERVAVATVPVVNGVALVDADGRVVATATSPPPDLIAIGATPRQRAVGATVERTVRAALAVIAELPDALEGKVGVVQVAGKGTALTVDLDLKTGVTVRLGSLADIPSKLRAAVAVLESAKPSGGSVLDVRVPRSPTLRRSGPAQPS